MSVFSQSYLYNAKTQYLSQLKAKITISFPPICIAALQNNKVLSLICVCLRCFVFQAREPVHSSKGSALIGSQWHSWTTQSWSLAAAGWLPRQPWPAWTLPHPHHQGKFTQSPMDRNKYLIELMSHHLMLSSFGTFNNYLYF